MNEFLNPKSMLTPGAAGALVMFLSNSICAVFPECAFRYVALFLSLVVGAIVFTATAMRVLPRMGYWVINSLIIFAMGIGSSNIGANLSQAVEESDRAEAYMNNVSAVAFNLFAWPAWAETQEAEGAPLAAPGEETMDREGDLPGGDREPMSEGIMRAEGGAEAVPGSMERGQTVSTHPVKLGAEKESRELGFFKTW